MFFQRFILILLFIPVFIFAQVVTDYQITVALHPDFKTISGTELITWSNASNTPVTDIFFNAHLNAFKNSSSSYFKEARYADPTHSWVADANSRAAAEWGGLDIQSIKVTYINYVDTDVLTTLVYVQPDDGNASDQTLFKIQLPSAIPAGISVRLTLAFTAKLPLRAPGTGFDHDYFLASHWYPQICFQDDEGWKIHQFHYYGSSFAGYSSYTVSITVPNGYSVGTSGRQTDSTRVQEQTTYHFSQDQIQDFSWVASPDLKNAKQEFRQSDTSVEMRIFYFSQHKNYLKNIFSALTNGLKYFGTWYQPFPYSQITVVELPWEDGGATASPLFIVTHLQWPVAQKSCSIEKDILSGLAHQYWGGLVNIDGTNYPWLTDGLSCYSTFRCLNAAYGGRSYSKTYLQRPGFGIPLVFPSILKSAYSEEQLISGDPAGYESLDRGSWAFENLANYPFNIFIKSARMFWTLENYLGEQKFSTILQTMVKEHQFTSTIPKDFIETVLQNTTEPVQTILDQMISGNGKVDYSVVKIVSIETTGDGTAAITSQKSNYKTKKQYQSTVVVHRAGDVQIPVDIQIAFENGDVVKEIWDGKGNWHTFQFQKDTRITRVDVDPENKLVLDQNRTNNSRYYRSSFSASLKWSTQWLYWLQHFFEVVAFFS